jgi:hypothetical protein
MNRSVENGVENHTQNRYACGNLALCPQLVSRNRLVLHSTARGWGRSGDDETTAHQVKWRVVHNPQHLQLLLPLSFFLLYIDRDRTSDEIPMRT